MQLSTVDEAGSGFAGRLSGLGLSGTVATERVVIASYIGLPHVQDRLTMELSLNDEFQLVGTAKSSSGLSANVVIPLF